MSGRRQGAGRRWLATVLALPTAVAAGLGWLYVLRGLGWFAAGPAVVDSLPLLQLAAFDRQPLLRVVVAWLCTGLWPAWRSARSLAAGGPRRPRRSR